MFEDGYWCKMGPLNRWGLQFLKLGFTNIVDEHGQGDWGVGSPSLLPYMASIVVSHMALVTTIRDRPVRQ